MDAGSDTTLTSDLANFAVVKSIGKTAKDTLLWLGSHRENWLLILDNADGTTLNLRNYFPRGNHGNIIITTRNRDVRIRTDDEAICDVSQLNREDAAALFLRVTQIASDELSTERAVDMFVGVSSWYTNRRHWC